MRKIITIISCIFFLVQCKKKQNETVEDSNHKIENSERVRFPKPVGFVSDFEKTLSNEQVRKLGKILSDYEKKSTNQIVIVSISKDLTEENFNNYALDLANNWAFGTVEKNNGLTIVYSSKLNMIRICTGIGTEKILTDEICEKVLNEKIIPEFKNGNYYGGLESGVKQFIRLWN